MPRHDMDAHESLRGAAADVLYSNGVLDLSALSDWIEASEAEQRARGERLQQLEREAQAHAPLVQQATAALEGRRGEVRRGLSVLAAAQTPPAELERLRHDFAAAEAPQELEAVAGRVERLVEEAFPTQPAAQPVEGAGRDPSRELAAFRMPGGTER